jgi:hypothetical protein
MAEMFELDSPLQQREAAGLAPSDLTVVCAWCGVEMQRATDPRQVSPVSHGICDPCLERVLPGEGGAEPSVFV